MCDRVHFPATAPASAAHLVAFPAQLGQAAAYALLHAEIPPAGNVHTNTHKPTTGESRRSPESHVQGAPAQMVVNINISKHGSNSKHWACRHGQDNLQKFKLSIRKKVGENGDLSDLEYGMAVGGS